MTQDQMIDVFPIVFDFKKGEQPTAQKLTGVNQLINEAFSEITQIIGDPWDSQSHSWGIGSDTKKLSLEKLSQPSLSRIIGPSDWLSPNGGDFNEPSIATNFVTLKSGQNSWNLGYPIVKVSSTITETSTVSSLTPLNWGTEVIRLVDIYQILQDEKTTPEAVVEDGDFYVDYYTGVITSYKASPSDIVLNFLGLHMLSPGVPWGTHNVIPTWNQTSSLCSLTLDSDNGITAVYTLSFPVAGKSSRVSPLGKTIAGGSYSALSYDSTWGYDLPNPYSDHRIPSSLINSGILVGDTIPEGFMLLWDEVAGRIRDLLAFKYKDENSVTIEGPSGLLSVGSNYRLITTGSSIAENISYLIGQQRFEAHNGLSDSAGLGYSTPLSHKDLSDRFSGEIYSISSLNEDVFKFRESNYPTNDHPQYLHRSGYLSGDSTGNTSNAMRGILGFSETVENGLKYALGDTLSGNRTETYGIYWGGPSSNSIQGNTRLLFDGGTDISTWSSGISNRVGFGLQDTGALPVSSYSNEKLGALSLYSWYGTPLYLRGQATGPTGSSSYQGAVLGFDLGQNSELNYIKLIPGVRSTSYDVAHLPAKVSQYWDISNAINPCMPYLSNPISATQLREFRFRGGAYVSTASNPEGSLGGSSTRSDGGISEFENYYTSPGVVGADFFNVYSNAIFFSEIGDGKNTSLTSSGTNWMNAPLHVSAMTNYYGSGSFNYYQPTGFYYHPKSTSVPYSDAFIFSIKDSTTTAEFSQPLRFGDRSGFHYASNRGGDIRFSTKAEGSVAGGIILASGTVSKQYVDNLFAAGTNDYSDRIFIKADDQIVLFSTEETSLYSETFMDITALTTLTLRSHNGILSLKGGPSGTHEININASGDITETGNTGSFVFQNAFSLSSVEDLDIQTTTAGKPITLWNTTSGTGTNGKIFDPNNGHISLQSTTGLHFATQTDLSHIRFDVGYNLDSAERGWFYLAADSSYTYVRDGSDETRLILSPNGSTRIDADGSITLSCEGQLTLDPGDNLRFLNIPTSSVGLDVGEIWCDTASSNVLKMVT